MQRALFLNLCLGYLLTPFLLGRGVEIPGLAASTRPDSCLSTFTICFHLQEGELHPRPHRTPGCVGFGAARGCFILGTGRAALHQLLNNNTPGCGLRLQGAEQSSSLRQGDTAMPA